MPNTLKTRPEKPKSSEADLAYLILINTHNTTKSFLNAFVTIRGTRNARGTPTDNEQDLLRAMLLFASSGLDSMIKQLIKDALPIMIEYDDDSKKEFKKFVEKELRLRPISNSTENLNIKTLASLIVEDSPKKALIDRLVQVLTSDSLQSVDQLYRVAAYLGVKHIKLDRNKQEIQDVFDVRNKIGHEMDIDFSQSNRNRFPRRKEDMIGYTNTILDIADKFIKVIDSKLSKFKAKPKKK